MIKIISGGQTGVDQAGLTVARQLGLSIGGWCPKQGLDENGVCILNQFPLYETPTTNPNERTRLNVRDSDGTLIILPTWPLPKNLTDGTQITIAEVKLQNKPHLIIRLDKKEKAIEKFKAWLEAYPIGVLNIAGPRESSSPGINKQAYAFLQEAFALIKPATY